MSFAITLIAYCGTGLALLRLLRLDLGNWAADLSLAWFFGAGYFSLVAAALRLLAGVSYSAPIAIAILLAPPLVWLALRKRLVHAAPDSQAPARWLPQPIWLWAPIAIYVLLTVGAVLWHGYNTPTNTDDAARVRAFAPLLAAEDAWSPEARNVFIMAGVVPTFAPSLAWKITGRLDHFHVNYVTLADLLALLVLSISIASARGRPERGWLSAFAVLSLPLFVYHCTSTYADALLAIFLGAAMLFLIEFAESSHPADAARAICLITIAAMVKREGELVAAPLGLLVLAVVAWRLRVDRMKQLLRVGLCGLPYLLFAAVKIAAVGGAAAFPFVVLFMNQAAAPASAAGAATAVSTTTATVSVWTAFVYAVFNSGNAGMLYYVLLPVVVLGARAIWRSGYALSLLAVAVLFGEAAVSSLWLFPRFTLDQSTVHRALFPASVAAALWLAAFLSEWVRSPRSR